MTIEHNLSGVRTEIRSSQERFVVDFWPTGRCDMECPFCYGADVPVAVSGVDNLGAKGKIFLYDTTPETMTVTGSDKLRPEMTIQQMKDVVSKLKAIGVTTLTVAGGEPLIRQETPSLIQFAHSIGLELYLSTNGTFLRKRYDQVKDFIFVLGLPLDGSSPEMNVLMGRKVYLYENIKRILSYFKNSKLPHNVKVGTVVSRINISDIEAIGELLYRTSELYHPDTWRLYQFEPLKEGKKNSSLYEISDSEFSDVVGSLGRKFPEAKISARSNNDHVNAYFFVTPDGMLQIVDIKHRSIADLLRINVAELRVLISDCRDTKERAGKNREWLEQKSSCYNLPHNDLWTSQLKK